MLLIVFGGNKGNGFSVTAIAEVVAKIPEVLRETAKGIEESIPSDLAAIAKQEKR